MRKFPAPPDAMTPAGVGIKDAKQEALVGKEACLLCLHPQPGLEAGKKFTSRASVEGVQKGLGGHTVYPG